MIVTLDTMAKIRYTFTKSVGMTSGGFDPIHPGHISSIQDGKKLINGPLIVVVNGDAFLKAKKGFALMPLETRCAIVDAIEGVDYVVPFEIENDMTVIKAIEALQPDYFIKGGDRVDETTIPEWDVCHRNFTTVLTGIGAPKLWSSSSIAMPALSYLEAKSLITAAEVSYSEGQLDEQGFSAAIKLSNIYKISTHMRVL